MDSQNNLNGRRKMRVLHVGKFYVPHVGGIETHLRILCNEIKDLVDLKVIVANDSARTERRDIEGVNVTRLGRHFNVASTPICPLMAREIRKSRADLVHVHMPNPWAVFGYLLSGHRGPLVVTWHSDVIRQKTLGRAFDVMAQSFLRRCNAIIATSTNYIESSPVLSDHRTRCFAIPFGIPSTELAGGNDAGTISGLRQRYGTKIVLSAGRLVYYKGIDVLIRAMNSVDATLLVAGDGPLRARLEYEADANPVVRKRVRFLGHVEDLTPLYHASDVFALPSVARSEGFGIVQLEAMACGKPVVNTRLDSGVPYVSLDGVTGITVTPGSQEELAAALNRLLLDNELRVNYGRAALHRVRTEFTVRSMVARTLKVYRDVAGDGYTAADGWYETVSGADGLAHVSSGNGHVAACAADGVPGSLISGAVKSL
jgi:glycosyltransferase involved in cell wall biosynthesis